MMEKNFAVAAEYLVLPVRNAGEEGRLRLFVDDQIVLDYGVSFASGPEDVDWYAFFSLDRFRGREARVSASNVTEKGFDLVRQADSIPGADGFYRERLRPHGTTSRRGPAG